MKKEIQKRKIIKVYRKKDVVEHFDKARLKYYWQLQKHELEKNIVITHIKNLKKSKVKILDVGCGTGRFVRDLFNTGKKIEYHGIDTSKLMLKKLKKRVKDLPSAFLHYGDACKMHFNSNSFDIVYTYHLMWHLPLNAQKEIFEEIVRVTRKNGIIIFDVLNKDFIWEKIKSFLKLRSSPELYKLSWREIDVLLRKFNLKFIELKGILDLPVKSKILYIFLSSIPNIVGKHTIYHMLYVVVKK